MALRAIMRTIMRPSHDWSILHSKMQPWVHFALQNVQQNAPIDLVSMMPTARLCEARLIFDS